MPPKKAVAAGTSNNPLAPAGKRQRTLTNKQQQLGELSSHSDLRARLIGVLLVAQRNEKEESAKQRALTDAVRSEQRQEELNGFYKAKQPGKVFQLLNSKLLISSLLQAYPPQTVMTILI
jgi:hypothetical protein